ncbi:Conjugal transfer protein TraB [Candidatus Magnetomoraceae bacterium gMMP-15]
MATIDEQILRASKEIVVKFIEVGRVSPNGFGDIFNNIYVNVKHAVEGTYNQIKDDTESKEKVKK